MIPVDILATNAARIVFAVRNGNKAINQGDIGRGSVASVHAVSIMDDISRAGVGKVSEAAAKATGGLNKIGENVLKIDKISSVASKAINPLLCIAAAARALGDDNKEAALVEETVAMGAMFGAETLFKAVKTPMEALVKAGSSNVADVAKQLAESKGLASKLGGKVLNNKTASGVFKTIADFASKSKGRQAAVMIASGLAFAAVSIFGYSMGKKLGEKISGRSNEKKVASGENPFK